MADLATTVQNWVGSAGTAQSKYAAGVQATTVDVVARAVAAQPKLLANVTQAITSGFWARQLQAKGTAGWKSATLAKANNYSVGFQAGEANYSNAMQTWLPIIMSAATGKTKCRRPITTCTSA